MGKCFSSWRLRWRRHRHGGGANPCSSCRTWCRSSCPASCGSAKAVRIGCTKSYLVVLNFMFLICGSTVLGLGCWMHIERQAFIYVELLQNIPSTGLLVLFDRLPAVFIVIGGSVAILSFLGCCGACADSAFFLCLYTFLLCLILITEVIIAVLIIAFREQILLKVESSLKYQIRNEYNKSGTPSNLTTIDTDHVTVLLDAMQKQLRCCGSSGPEDYRHSAWYNFSKTKYEMFVPMSCCLTVFNYSKGQTVFKDENKCQIDAVLYIYENHQEKREMVIDSLNTQGCNRSVVNWFNSNMFILVSIVCIVITLQILDLSSACVLMSLVIQKHSDCRWAEEAGTEIG